MPGAKLASISIECLRHVNSLFPGSNQDIGELSSHLLFATGIWYIFDILIFLQKTCSLIICRIFMPHWFILSKLNTTQYSTVNNFLLKCISSYAHSHTQTRMTYSQTPIFDCPLLYLFTHLKEDVLQYLLFSPIG